MRRIVSFTGPSGTGKTTLAGELLKKVPAARLIQSYTTRNPRHNDLPDEYFYVSVDEFNNMSERGVFLWTAEHGGTNYGTSADSIKEIFKSNETIGVMILVPEVIHLLFKFLYKIGKDHQYLPIFIVPPQRSLLEERLRKRGDKDEIISLRLDQARDWLRQAERSGLRYRYIVNDTDISVSLGNLLTFMEM